MGGGWKRTAASEESTKKALTEYGDKIEAVLRDQSPHRTPDQESADDEEDHDAFVLKA